MGAKPTTNVELVDALCRISAPLREAHRDHLASFGTLVPHVFMGAVLAYVGSSLAAKKAKADAPLPAEIAQILESLERGMDAGDRETRNVISMSFVSDGELEPFFEMLKPVLGPKVRAQLQGK
jgi:hypothetical protein